MFSINFDEIINDTQIDFQKLFESTISKLSLKDSYVLSYEEFCCSIDKMSSLFDVYEYKIKIIENNLFHNFYPFPEFLSKDNLIDQISSNNDSVYNRIFDDYVIIDNEIFVEYAGFEETFNIMVDDLFDIREFHSEIEEDDSDDERISFGSSEETYLQFLKTVIQNNKKKINISIDSNDLFTYQKNLLSILNSYGYNIRLVKRKIMRTSDPREVDYLNILKRKNKTYEFRNIKFYNNPGFSLETRSISQSEIISSLIINSLNANEKKDYNDIFVTAPTGSGKSILFQIPAIYLAEKKGLLTIIITPLIGLMNDQIQNIQAMTDCAATINSEYTPEEKNEIKKLITEKKVSILYLSPETLLSNNPITNLIGNREIGLLVIDESHIVSTWGKSFRPDYWFLGDYISYLRTKFEYSFPIAAFSATVTYGGNDDMHGDIIDGLKMKTGEFEYIAPMRRDDISFDIHIIEKENDYLKEKNTLVEDRLNELIYNHAKTIAYFPYTSQVDDFIKKFYNKPVARYHGNLKKIEKDLCISDFKNGSTEMILATKAFGMGIDIDDVKVVYHYAPTGNLCDYIQEIGRAARSVDVKGTAKLDFFENDFRYIKQLFGMSSIKNYQLVETLKKLRNIYLMNNKRNFTVSPDDFSNIFPNCKDMQNVDNSFKTVMLMIQKDFERNPNVNFKPIIFKPRSMFTKGYFMVENEDLDKIKRSQFFKYFTLFSTADDLASEFTDEYNVSYLDNKTFDVKNYTNKISVKVRYKGSIYVLDFKKMWEDNFNDLSFAKFKHLFYAGELNEFKISQNLLPEYLLTIMVKSTDFEHIIGKLESIMRTMVLEFSKPDIDKSQIKIEDIAKKIEENNDISLNHYESLIAAENFIEVLNKYKKDSNFGNQFVFKKNNSTNRYSIISVNLLKKRINTLIYDIKSKFASVQKTSKKVFLLNLKRNNNINNSKEILIAQIFEIFRLATYRVVSGERSGYFVRINSITQIEKILNDEYYKSEMVNLIKYRHEQSIKIMNKFFMKLDNDKDRWDFIERYFAGFLEEIE